jgi:Arc/MetJ-type ribon-helix-helix transcriptional regulator
MFCLTKTAKSSDIMTEESDRVTVRIPQELLSKLKQIQEMEGHPTISDTIRESLIKYVEIKMAPPNIRKVVVDLSRQDNTRLEELVQGGGSVSVDDAIRSAVREYVRSRMYAQRGDTEESDSATP